MWQKSLVRLFLTRYLHLLEVICTSRKIHLFILTKGETHREIISKDFFLFNLQLFIHSTKKNIAFFVSPIFLVYLFYFFYKDFKYSPEVSS